MTKQEFPYPLAKLWDRSFLTQHSTSGFRRTGLCPLSRYAILTSRLTKALPFSRPAMEPEPQPHQDEPSALQADQNAAVKLVETCTIGSTVTLILLRLMGYFSWVLQKNKENKWHPADKLKVKLRFYGKALLSIMCINGWQRKSIKKKKLEREKQRKPGQAPDWPAAKWQERKVQDRVGPRDEEKFVYPQTIVARTQTVSRRKSHFFMVRKEPHWVQRSKKIFARNVIENRMMTKSTGSDVIPVYAGSTIIVLVLQVSQMDFGLAHIV